MPAAVTIKVGDHFSGYVTFVSNASNDYSAFDWLAVVTFNNGFSTGVDGGYDDGQNLYPFPGLYPFDTGYTAGALRFFGTDSDFGFTEPFGADHNTFFIEGSNYTEDPPTFVYASGPAFVPENGSTLALLGLALAGVVTYRRHSTRKPA